MFSLRDFSISILCVWGAIAWSGASHAEYFTSTPNYSAQNTLIIGSNRTYGVGELGWPLDVYQSQFNLKQSPKTLQYAFDTNRVSICTTSEISILNYSDMEPERFFSHFECFDLNDDGSQILVTVREGTPKLISQRGIGYYFCGCADPMEKSQSRRLKQYIDRNGNR